jgi:hypothetical protein
MVLVPGTSMRPVAMPGTPHLLSPAPSERPPCPLCGTPMWVVRIEPLHSHLRTPFLGCSIAFSQTMQRVQ